MPEPIRVKLSDLESENVKPIKVSVDQLDQPEEEDISAGGIARAMGRQFMDFSAGGGSGIVRTAVGLRDFANRGTKALGLGELPNVPESIRATAKGKEFENGQEVEPSAAFQIGRAGETLAEFAAPGSMATKGANVAAKLGSKVGPTTEMLAEIGGRAAADAAAVGAVTAAHGEAMEDVARAALTAGALSGAFATVGTALKSIPTNRLYTKGLKFPQRFQGQREDEIIGKAIDDGILISYGGANKAEALEKMKKADVIALINQHKNDLVDLNIVRKPLIEFRQQLQDQGYDNLANQITKRLESYERSKGALPGVPGTPPTTTTSSVVAPVGRGLNAQPITKVIPGTPAVPPTPAKITIGEAQKSKEFIQQIADQAYGKNKPSRAQTEKLLAAGIARGIENIIPEVKQLNRDAQNYKLLKQAITKYVNANPELLSPRTAVLALWNSKAALLYGALQNPFIRSALAVAKDRMEKLAPPVLQAIPRIGGGAINEGQTQ